MVCAVVAAAVLSDVLYLVMSRGHASLRERAATAEPVMQPTEAVSSEEAVIWKDGWVKYNGGIYEYKDSTMNFLIMGMGQDIEGDQADFLALLVLDADEENIKLIPIDANAMITDEADGNQAVTEATSCEEQVKAVSNLLHQLPIHGYAALSLDGIVPLNDEIGGIDVVTPIDFKTDDISAKKGEELHLAGEDAHTFLCSKTAALGGTEGRLARQEVYLRALVEGLYNKIKADSLSLLSMYNIIGQYITTDIGTKELAYLATQASKYTYDDKNVLEIEGKTVEGETSEEFYVDDDALKELLIDTFYKKVR